MATFNQTRLDQYLDGVITAWQAQDENAFVANRICPVIPVNQPNGTLLESDDSENILRNARQAPLTPPGEVTTGVREGAHFLCQQVALRELVGDDEVAAGQEAHGIDVKRHKVEKLAGNLRIAYEGYVSAMFRSVAYDSRDYDSGLGVFADYATQVVTLTGGSHWNESAVDPSDAVETALQDYFAANSIVATHIVLPYKVALAVGANAQYKAEYSANRDTQALFGMLPIWRGLQVVISTGFLVLNGVQVPFFGNDAVIFRQEPWRGNGYAGFCAAVKYTKGEQGVKQYRHPDEGLAGSYIHASLGEYDFSPVKLNGNTRGYLIRDCLLV